MGRRGWRRRIHILIVLKQPSHDFICNNVFSGIAMEIMSTVSTDFTVSLLPKMPIMKHPFKLSDSCFRFQGTACI